jgi:ferredoxin
MPYVVTDSCILCKYKRCVQVCPVDAFREGPNSIAIDPEACIDCNFCEPECPVKAIYPGDMVPEEMKSYIALNAELAKEWPVATFDLGPLPEGDKWAEVKDKLKYLKR